MSSSSTATVRVNLGPRSYDIAIGSGILAGLGNWFRERSPAKRVVLICDQAVRSIAEQAAAALTSGGFSTELLDFPSGEGSKSLAQAERLYEALLRLQVDRKTVVAAVGGGVAGDLGGFVAATYNRGQPFLQIPTTLLADVDSSVGGKVGVNLPGAKNVVGAFWQPSAVLIDLDSLISLPAREYRSGLAEVVKYGVILDAPFFAYLEANAAALSERSPEVLREVVARCCRLKADVVERDEREETGLRAVLNYGHTFAHAWETVLGYGELLHGEAVAIGMLQASRLAERLGRIGPAETRRQRELLLALGLPVTPPQADPERLLAVMRRDKKTEHGELRFILPSRLGAVETVAVPTPTEVYAVLAET